MTDNKNTVPQISRVTEFRRGEPIQIYAEGISRELIDDKSGVYIWYPEGNADETTPFNMELPLNPPENSIRLSFDNVFKQVGYTAPSKLVKTGVAIVWVENKCGLSQPFRVNQPRIFNQSRLKVIKNSLIEFFGASMSCNKENFSCMTSKTLLLYNPITEDSYYVTNANDNAYPYNKDFYISQFIVPSDIPAAKYKAYVNNGSGGKWGWSDAVEVEVCETQTLVEYYSNKCFDTISSHRYQPESETIIIKPDDNGPETDMSEKIQTAIDSLENGGVIKLTSGVYGIGKSIILKSGVVIRGAGKHNTVLKTCESCEFSDDWSNVVFASRHHGLSNWANDWRKHLEKGKSAAIIHLTDNCGIEDLGIEFGLGANIGILVANINSSVSNGVFINNISVDSGYKNSYCETGSLSDSNCIGLLSVVSTNDLVVYNSQLKAVSPIKILPARNMRLKLIHNCIECSPAQIGESFVCGIYNSIILGNSFLNGRRSLLMQEGCSNNLFYQNRSYGVSRAVNAQEQYMSECGISIWHGCSEKNGNNYITIKDVDKLNVKETLSEYLEEHELYLCVLDGKGFGQYRKIIGNNGDKVFLDSDWDVIPDENTLLTVIVGTVNNIYLNNNSENGNGPTNIVWGCGLDNIVNGHEVVLSYAMTLHSYCCLNSSAEFPRQKAQYGIVAFNQFVGCQVKASGMGIRTGSSGPRLHLKDEYFDRYMRHHGIFGTIIKGNAFEGSKGQCYLKNQGSWIEETYNCGMDIGGAYNLILNNFIAGYANAIKLRYDCEGNYFAKNKFLYCENNFVFEPRHNYFAYLDDRTVGPDADKMWFIDRF